jgi:hypothetical protein
VEVEWRRWRWPWAGKMKMIGRGAAKEEEKSKTSRGRQLFCFAYRERCRLVRERFRFRFRVFCVASPQMFKIALPFYVCWRLLFIGKNIVRSQTWSLYFFFVNFNFSYFLLYFLKTSNINIDSMRIDFKNDALKVERIPNIFENLNSFETMLKMLKTMQIYLKKYFFGFSMFFAIFGFFWKFIKTLIKKIR